MKNYPLYDSIIRSYCSDWNNFKKKYRLEMDVHPIVEAFVYVIKEDFPRYEKIIQGISIDMIDEKSEEYLFLLEGRVRYDMYAHSRKIMERNSNFHKIEFTEFCRKSLTLFPFAFFSSRGLAHLLISKNQLNEARSLLDNIWNHGYQTDGILQSQFFIAMKQKEWIDVKK